MPPPPTETPPTRRKILRPSALTAFLVTGSRVCAFLAALAAVNEYGTAEFGAIGVAQQIAMYAIVIAGAGMDMYAVRHVVRTPEQLGTIASTVMLWRVGLGVVMYALVLLAAVIIPPLQDLMVLLAVFGVTLFTQACTVLWIPQAVQRPLVHGATHLATQTLFLGLVQAAIHQGYGPWTFPASMALAQAVVAVGLLVWMKAKVSPLRRPLPFGAGLKYLKTAAPFGASNMLRGLATASDLILLGVLIGKTVEVGWYSGVTRLYLFGHGMLSVYFVVLFPVFVERAAQGSKALGRELRRSLLFTTPPVVLALAVNHLYAGDILRILFPDDFVGGATSLRYLSAALFAGILAGQCRHALLAMNRQVTDMRNTGLAVLIHVAVKVVLIPRYGILGAAIGTLVGELVFLVLSVATLLGAFARWRGQPTDVASDA